MHQVVWARTPTYVLLPAAIEEAVQTRQTLGVYGDSDVDKSEGLQIDGFGALSAYYSSDMVELLEYGFACVLVSEFQ